MSPGKWRPKQWATKFTEPTEGTSATLIGSQQILKDRYPDQFQRPWWAKLAKEQHWISDDEYYDIPQTEPLPKHKNPLVDMWVHEYVGIARRFFGGLITVGAVLEYRT